MKHFAELYSRLDETNATSAKIEILSAYFSSNDDAQSKTWTLFLLSGEKISRVITTKQLRLWAQEKAQIPEWLFTESYQAVGDLAETISLLLPPPRCQNEESLCLWMHKLSALSKSTETEKRSFILTAWNCLGHPERMVFHKILTGGFRVEVSPGLVIKALSQSTGLSTDLLMHRLMGKWSPQNLEWTQLLSAESLGENISKPYPFALASVIEKPLAELGHVSDWIAEWKWDGIRGQLIKRQGKVFLWSRGEELLNGRFPEIEAAALSLPDGTVLDGEVLPSLNGDPLPFAQLQPRMTRNRVNPALMAKYPVVFMAYDLLENHYVDLRSRSCLERRARLTEIVAQSNKPHLLFSPALEFDSWQQLQDYRNQARQKGTEGLMLKRAASPYHAGRKEGDWWKWKLAPLSIDAVLVYAQKGQGTKTDLYTDYTFAVRDNNQWTVFAKAHSGLSDAEIREVDTFIKSHTVERFGPVRTVVPTLVFEIGFDGITPSNRHKCGIACRSPRILQWRRDKQPLDADTIETLKSLIPKKDAAKETLAASENSEESGIS